MSLRLLLFTRLLELIALATGPPIVLWVPISANRWYPCVQVEEEPIKLLSYLKIITNKFFSSS